VLLFDDGGLSENGTFLLTDWLAHTPREVLAQNFGVSVEALDALPPASATSPPLRCRRRWTPTVNRDSCIA